MFKAVKMLIVVFWVMTSAMKMQAIFPSDTLVTTYKAA
jgi:hypothetical protein